MKTRKRYNKNKCLRPFSNWPGTANGKPPEKRLRINEPLYLAGIRATPDARAVSTQTGTVESTFVAPRTPSEHLMASVWQDILKLERIGIFDNFFDIVNDSYLAIEVIERTRQAFSVSLPVRDLFADPTVAGMTATVLRTRCEHPDGLLTAVEARNYSEPTNGGNRSVRKMSRTSE